MEQLNKLELTLLQEIINYNKEKYPFLIDHFDFLYVKSRENTGVGHYTNFGYTKVFPENSLNTLISSDKDLYIKGIDNGLAYVLSIDKGRIDYLEIVINGEGEFNYHDNQSDFNLT